MRRVVAGVALAGLTLWICLGASAPLRTAALALAVLLCLAEALQLALERTAGSPPGDRSARAIGFALFALAALAGAPSGLPGEWVATAPFLIAATVGALALFGAGARGGALLIAALWIGLPAVAILDLASGREGGETLLFLILVVVAGEVGAFCGGRLVGGLRLAPVLSPGKTWAGLWFQLAVSAAAAPAVGFLLPGAPGPGGLAGIGLLLGGAAALGDLYESSWKRGAGQKDSGRLIPGHGGALDRADGLLFAALALQAALPFLPVTPWDRAEDLLRANEPEAALEILRPLEADHPDRFEVIVGLGRAYFQLGDWWEASRYLAEAAGLRPPDAPLLKRLGRSFQEQGDRGGAIQAFERSLALDPDQPDVRARLEAVRPDRR